MGFRGVLKAGQVQQAGQALYSPAFSCETGSLYIAYQADVPHSEAGDLASPKHTPAAQALLLLERTL